MAADLKWRKHEYASAESLTLARGFLVLYVGWAIVYKNDQARGGEFEAKVNGKLIPGRYKTSEDAKEAAVQFAFDSTSLAREQLKNFLQEDY